MSSNEDRVPSALYCSGERYRECSPESCPGLTAQCTDRCVVVTCSDPHDDDREEVCGEIICDDQSCTDPIDCHGIYEFLQRCDDYHDYVFCDSKPHNMDQHTTDTAFNGAGWDPAFDVLLSQGYQHRNEDLPAGCYDGMSAPPLTLTPGTVTTMIVSSSRSSTPPPSPVHSRHHPYAHPNAFQQNHQQHIVNTSPPFHNLTQPNEGLTFKSDTPSSHNPPSVSPQSHLTIGQTGVAEEHPCMWANCRAMFGSLQDLVAHVNVQHLQAVSTSIGNQLNLSQDPVTAQHQHTLSPPGLTFPSCHWGDCHVYPTAEHVPSSSDRPVDAALGVLAAHLWECHLGLRTPPPQFIFPPATTLVAGNTADLGISPSLEDVDPKVQESPVEVEMMDASPLSVPTSLVAAEADPVAVGDPSLLKLGPGSFCDPSAGPTRDQNHGHDQGHDCATADHPCKWSDCQEGFATCEALMAHITVEHVGCGKNHYECFWDGCGRNGDKGFKSKQKICRHIQSHTGHRPHQCEVCQQCFSEVATLQQHMRRHTQEKPYECDHPGCGKRFAIMGALTIHKRMHNGDKPFKCPQCDKAFSESSNLSKHLRTHTGERPYACPEPGCGKCFGRGDQLTRHMNVHASGGKAAARKATAAASTEDV